MRNTITFALLAIVAGCADQGFYSGDAGTGTPESCSQEGQKRCAGQSWRECKAGVFVPVKECADPKVCIDQFGCVDCDPTLSKGCIGNDVYDCNSDGTAGSMVQSCGELPCKNGVCGSTCSEGTGLIYLVDDKDMFLSFNPENNANVLKEVGTLGCPATASWPAWASPTATPFSMSVDRQGKAWVLYSSGEVFWVNIKTAACIPSPLTKGKYGYQLFGMGFVSDKMGSQQEKLYIHGGQVNALEKGNLGYIDPMTMEIKTIGPLPFTGTEHSPELTGTGAGLLYGFFPNGATSYVRRIDKVDGRTLQTWNVSAPAGQVKAWAFAHWGGKFYIFITVVDPIGKQNSAILMLEPDTGKSVTLKQNLPYAIVGAGVSTCAPTID